MFKFQSTTTFSSILFILIASLTQNCSDDANPIDKKERINSIGIEVWGPGALDPVEVEFTDDDEDGVFDIDPDIPVVLIYIGNTNRINFWSIGLWADSFVDADIQSEKEDHILCFEVTNNVVTAIEYLDEDSEGRPVGLQTNWTANSVAGTTGEVKVTLRHQPGLKTGECPGEGEIVDFQIIIPVEIFD